MQHDFYVCRRVLMIPTDRLGTEFKLHHLFFMTNSSCNKIFDILDLQ